MNNRILPVIFSLLLLTLVYPVFAQQGNIAISGKITSSDGRSPIHFANISIDRKGVGTSTNAAGMFALIIPADNVADTLKISHIGFKTQLLPIAGLRNGQDLSLMLEKNVTQLQEVTIAYYDAAKIIQKAIERIPENYINYPHILRGFYRMYAYHDNDPLQLSEAVFDVYNFGYTDKRADLFKLIKARSENNTRDLGTVEFGQKPNTIFEEDVVNHLAACGFLNDEGITKHQFEIIGVVDIKGYKAYEIDFKEKAGSADETYRGKFYIDTKTYAFIYFDFGLSPAGLKVLSSGNFVLRSMVRNADIEINPVEDHTTVGYQQVGNRWVLSDVEGDDAISIKAPGKDDLLTHLKFNYQVTAVDTTQQASFNSKIGRNANINAYKSNGDVKFWKDYNILLSDYNAEDVFKQIQETNKLK